jgi:hypothetical protein
MDKFMSDIRKQMALDEMRLMEQLLSLTLHENAVSRSLADTKQKLQK